MNIRTHLICICAVALLAGPAVVSPLRAQSGQPRVENRLLLIFDTSSAMKKRLPAEQKAIDQLFEITLNGHLRAGDSVGVWTFNRDLHMGQFPQQEWSDDKASSLPVEIGVFLKKQRYTKDTRFDALIPTLDQVVATSPRLTTLIFCDGDGQVSGIPGADAINATFKAHQRQMEKARVPFVIVLRSQFDRDQIGQYVACTINSASSVSLPQFPPMPIPPQPPAPVKAPGPPPPPMAPPLIVIGTNTETNAAPPKAPPVVPPQRQSAPTLPPPANPATPAVPVPPAASPPPTIPLTQTNSTAQTNSAPPPAAAVQPTNQPTASTVLPSQATVPQNPPAAAPSPLPAEDSGMSKNRLLAAGAGLFIGVVAVVFLILRRSRGNSSTSLITESLKKR